MQNPDTGQFAISDYDKQIADHLARNKGLNIAQLAFYFDEVVEVKGGRFKIVAMGKNFMRLQGVPLDTPLGRKE